MSTVVSVENLGKKYVIAHEASARYNTLRDAVSSQARRLASALAGKGNLPMSTREEFWALKDVSFEIRDGDSVGIIGRNGAGKSTLLKILSRITAPSTGRVRIKGRVASLLEVGTGFHPELTGRENIFLNGAVLGMRKAQIASKFDEIVAFSEVEKFLDTPVKRYSSGMYVRLAFAVAAHVEPEILIVDEVLSVGDAQFQKKCLGKMEQVGNEGRTVLYVSHSLATVARLCPRCLLLENGSVVADGPTDGVIRRYLSGSADYSSCYAQPHDATKDMNLRRVTLDRARDDGAGHVRYDEPLAVCIEYEVNRPVKDCTVWAALQTMDGVMVLSTADHDMVPEMLERRRPGYYRAELAIPGKWLNVGEYNVVVGVVQNRPLIVYDRVETINFTVAEVGTPGSMTQEGVRRGVLQPYLPWRTERVSETGAK